MDIMTAVFCLSIAFGSFKIVEGLEIAPSSEPGFGKFYYAGSNLTISCSENNLMHLNWMKDTSDLSVCSIDQKPYCLPGTRYTYENESFNLMLINMKVKDCGQYKCITNTGSKSFDLHLIDFVKAIDVLEHSNDITMTTNCVLSANTVNVQWFFIDGDGSAVAYNKLAKRSELQGNCTEACWEDKALKVKSTLELPSKVKNPIKVKLMAYVEQGGKIMTRTSSNIFKIEGCAPPTKNGVIAAICIAVIFILGDLMYIIYSCPLRCQQRNDGKAVEPPLLPASDVNGASISKTHVEKGYVSRWMVDVFPAIVVSSIVCIFSIILFLLKHETKIPDLDGNCADVHVNNITMVVVIAFVIITISVNWKIIWIIDTTSHAVETVFAFMKKIKLPEFNCIHYITDYPTSQYRNKTMMHLINHGKVFRLRAPWPYWETGHGNGPCDGVGRGSSKRLADLAVKSQTAVIQSTKLLPMGKQTDKQPHKICLRSKGGM